MITTNTRHLVAEMASFGAAKQGNSDSDWEDAAAHSERRGCFAVADGAAAAYRAGLWSHLLATGFLADPFDLDSDEELVAWIARRSQEWNAQTVPAADAPYYVRHAQARGSHATFLAVEISAGLDLRALAVGDSCLLRFRAGSLVSAFPVTGSDAFGFHPDLIASNIDGAPAARRVRFALEPGDVVFGATDAAAEWLLRSHENGDSTPFADLLAAERSILPLVDRARRDGTLRNDDVTVVRCRIRRQQP